MISFRQTDGSKKTVSTACNAHLVNAHGMDIGYEAYRSSPNYRTSTLTTW
jgi:hypothetical protein